ncbi:IPT/TIG domain-containing protein [Prosthecobacter sp.]|uniref:beta strand repeat-containing protein n=1 Tax=Prosthecobacter sp. TaxID=1965333 RepID=UPI00248A6183|nr:IPT/TIG domain-containing protein [Prosthecobacter sp.]MDI1314812.1 IPT/TIG domain-containing protein [Prosthecobacter sp.]
MPAPTVSSILPSSGPLSGGVSVTITGTDFTGATGVTLGGAAATSVTVDSATQITCTTPAGTAGTASVVVTTPDGTNAANSLYTYVAAPTVSGVSPASGPITGGTSVVITGTNFTGATSVTLGGTAATSVTVDSSTQITCTAPAGTAGTASVLVTAPGGTNAANSLYTYAAVPTVTGITPAGGPLGGGASVTITGTNFTGTTGVTLGGAAATSVTVVSSTSITCTTPAGSAGTASVLVTTPGGTNAANSFYTYAAAPTVTGITPSGGPLSGGASVTITGTNFTGTSGVTLGGTAATGVSVVSSTSLTCTTPAHSVGTASVLVTTPSGTNASNSLYTYVAAPTVTVIAPTSGSANGGTSVTITGTNFTGTTGVNFGAAPATSVTVVSSTSITCTTPMGSAGTASVLVTTPGGTNAGTSIYTYVLTPPTVTDISPPAGTSAGGTPVTITGTNFTAATGVTIRGVPATGVTVVSDTSIICTTPSGTVGAASVAVTTPSGTASTNLFTYVQPPPTVTGTSANGISPATGSTLGGTTLTVTGTFFNGAGGVTIGGVPATNVTVSGGDNTTLTCITPAGSVGTASVVVTTVGGTNADNSLFTYALTPPSIASIFPTLGTAAGGTTVTISGQSLTGTTGVTIGGVAATRVILVNDTTLTCTTPVGSAGTAQYVVVTTPNGPSTDPVPFTYVLAQPTVISVSPPLGAAAGGTSLKITGTHFTAATGVTIGGIAATGITVVSDTILTCTTPAGLAGTASVLVTAAAGTSADNSLFTYITAAPTDTYIYLKGGRGDGFVPQWTGQLAEEGTTEKGEPYRNEFQSTAQLDNSASTSSGFTSGSNAYWGLGSSSVNGSNAIGFGGQMTTPGHLTKIVVTKEVVGNTAQTVNITPVFGALSDSVSGAAPRQFDKTATWMVFISSNGLGYKFRKTDVVGWGSQRRD